MKLYLKTFTNELGNRILLSIDDIPARKSVKITMRGPGTESTNEITYGEMAELRHALCEINV